MNFKTLATAALVCGLFISCSQDALREDGLSGGENADISAKFIHTSENATEGQLIVRFSSDAVKTVEESALLTKAADGNAATVTKSGIEDFDTVLESIGVVSLERVFPVDKRDEERLRAAGLHRWYLVKFSEDTDLDQAAVAMARVGEVSNVQFDRRIRIIGNAGTLGHGEVAPEEGLTKAGTKVEGSWFNDPGLSKQWHYINTGDTEIYSGIKAGADINVASAWKLCTGDQRVIVAVVDECVQWNHPDLAANMWVNEAELNGTDGVDDDGNGYVDDIYGYDFVYGGDLKLSLDDDDFHGTHVAGTIAAVNNNGLGACGIAGGDYAAGVPGVRIMACQIFDGTSGMATTANTARAIRYAAANGASILQCSWGYDAGAITSDSGYADRFSVEKEAIDWFCNNGGCDALDGGLAIFASGNEAFSIAGYPGAHRNYISVNATSCDYTPAVYTNCGPGSNISAPGGDVYQSYLETNYASEASSVYSLYHKGRYGYCNGTSMACPHVSGIAALGLSYALQLGKKFTREEFSALLLASVNDVDSYCAGTKLNYEYGSGWTSRDMSIARGRMGTGIIDAFQVLMNVRGTTCIPVVRGEQTRIDMADWIGDGNATFTVNSATVSQEDMNSLGMFASPSVSGTGVTVTCDKIGSGILSVTMTAGVNGSGMYGKSFVREFALISRESQSDNQGWL